MNQRVKIGETIGGTTVGYGESRIKWYGGDDSWAMVLLSGGKKCGELLFNSLEQMVQIKRILDKNFRIVPK